MLSACGNRASTLSSDQIMADVYTAVDLAVTISDGTVPAGGHLSKRGSLRILKAVYGTTTINSSLSVV